MRMLRLALQALIVYMAVAVLVGMNSQPSANVRHMLILASFFVGIFLISVLVQRGFRNFEAPNNRSSRLSQAVLWALLAVPPLVLAQGVAVGVWRGPSRLAPLHYLTSYFAGAWSLALAFGLLAAILLAQAIRALSRRAA